MKNYQIVDNPKTLEGKYFETRDGRFSDESFMISKAHWAKDNPKKLCILGYPDGLTMLYTILPNENGMYNLERIKIKKEEY
jgi:hypothetical protein